MLDWLLSPIDATRPHDVGFAVSWHARSMVLAWGVLAPVAVLVARFFKILPGQDWPRELDNQFWWRVHWIGQTCVIGLSVIALALVWPPDLSRPRAHKLVGWTVLAGLAVQAVLGLCRGSKGGPTAPARDGSLRGHHYDMTPWRRTFEAVHKTTGYATLGLAGIAILLGLWAANGPVWMWLALFSWWTILAAAFGVMQRRGMAVDTYQAIWGPDPSHPGNRLPHPGWCVRRLTDSGKDHGNVRRH